MRNRLRVHSPAARPRLKSTKTARAARVPAERRALHFFPPTKRARCSSHIATRLRDAATYIVATMTGESLRVARQAQLRGAPNEAVPPARYLALERLAGLAVVSAL